jgi:hypothetical protein
MIIGSINIRGFEWVGIISFEITSNHLDFIIINPETRFGVMVESLCHFLWSNTFYYWSFVPFVGNNRGFCVFLLCMELSRGLFRVAIGSLEIVLYCYDCLFEALIGDKWLK